MLIFIKILFFKLQEIVEAMVDFKRTGKRATMLEQAAVIKGPLNAFEFAGFMNWASQLRLNDSKHQLPAALKILDAFDRSWP